MKVGGIVIIIIALAILYSPVGASGSLGSERVAIESAYRYLGLDMLTDSTGKSANTSTHLVTYRDSTMPFLASTIDGVAAWKTRIEHVRIDTTGSEEAVQWSIQVILDSLSGRFLRADLWPEGVDTSSLYREPTSAEATRQLSMLGEQFLSLPPDLPIIGLSEGLRRLGYYSAAKHIVVWFVKYWPTKKVGSEGPYPVWFIILRGEPMIGPTVVEEYKTSSTRMVIDSRDGSGGGRCNIPYPELDN